MRKEEISIKSKCINIYTDGACSQNGDWSGGYGVYIENDANEMIVEISKYEANTTNNIMELKAFIEGLHHVENNSIDNRYIIYTDSAYITNCLKQRWYNNWRKNGWVNAKKRPVANKALWKELIGLMEQLQDLGYNLNYVKVKGHDTNIGNNKADALAVQARKSKEDMIKVGVQ